MSEIVTKRNLTEQLQSEARSCRRCNYPVTNPFYERCPRCNSLLPKLELFCSGCLHKSVCPVLAEQDGKSGRAGRGPEQGENHETRPRKDYKVF